MVLTKTIKLDDETLRLLTILKDELIERWPTEDITYDSAVYQLLTDYEDNNDPEIQRKKKEKILEEYVPRSAHDSAEARGKGWMEKYLTLERENRTRKVELDDREKEAKANANFEMTKCQDTIKKLQRDLTNKEKEIVVSGKRNNELQQKLNDIKTDLGQFSHNYYDAGSILLEKHFKSP